MRNLTPAGRLIVAADFKTTPEQLYGVRDSVLRLADSLADTDVYLKVNSALRLHGYELIHEIRDRGLRVFADLKLNDIPETMRTDGALLAHFKPDIVTAMASSGIVGMEALKQQLPDTEVLAVTVLTSLDNDESMKLFRQFVPTTVLNFAEHAHRARVDGLIASPKEVQSLRTAFPESDWPDLTLNTPGIRPEWATVEGDDQKRVMTPAEAISVGATRIVVGRPIIQADNPREAVLRTIEEIASAV